MLVAKQIQTDSCFLTNYFFTLPPISTTALLQPSYMARIYQSSHASLAMPNSLPTGPASKPYRHPKVSTLKVRLMGFATLSTCLPSAPRANSFFYLVRPQLLPLPRRLVWKSSLLTTRSLYNPSLHNGLRRHPPQRRYSHHNSSLISQ